MKIKSILLFSLFGLLSNNTYAQNLSTIYNQAKETNPELLQAKATKQSAFEAINESRAALLPQINLDAGFNFIRSDQQGGDLNTSNLGVTLNQSIYNRANWINLDIAALNAQASDTNYASAQQELMLNTVSAYFDILKSMDQLRFIRSEKKAVARQLEQVKDKFKVGLTPITDVHDAQASYDSVLASEIIAENNLDNSFESLREITGIEYKKLSTLNLSHFSAEKLPNSVSSIEKEALEKNLSIITGQMEQTISKREIKLAESGHLPTLSFNAGYDLTKQDYQDNVNESLSDTSNDFTAGINLNVPLYSGGAITSRTKQAQFNFVAKSEALKNTHRDVIKTIRASFNNINASIGTVHAYQQVVISAQSALDANEAGYQVGTRTIVDVLNATQSLYDAESELSSARYDYLLNKVKLKKAVGTLSNEDLSAINSILN
ncbi:outer membrane channel protein TolC [Vibrio sp. SS-MA-C1-2]|nr:outer membrane channel protein TolC [Vibrio sp. SS-MA-C1-2]UJF18724.1 outer membrane channel protein TolC [Vibrio sp. SS-MA-C1-2]